VALGVDACAVARATGGAAGIIFAKGVLAGEASQEDGIAVQRAALEAARTFIAAHWRIKLMADAVPNQNAKAALQEWAQGRGIGVPVYAIKSKSGPDHEPHFEVEAKVGVLPPANGEGRTRREAEQAAAAALLAREGVWKAPAR